MKQEAFRKFSRGNFGEEIFHQQNNALRINLCKGDTKINKFLHSYRKCNEIIKFIYNSTEHVNVCMAFYGENVISNISLFRYLKNIDISIQRPYEFHDEYLDTKEYHRQLIFFRENINEIYKYIWAKYAVEFELVRYLYFDIYIYVVDKGILVNPFLNGYLDITGTNSYEISNVYKRYGEHLDKSYIKKMNFNYKYNYCQE